MFLIEWILEPKGLIVHTRKNVLSIASRRSQQSKGQPSSDLEVDIKMNTSYSLGIHTQSHIHTFMNASI